MLKMINITVKGDIRVYIIEENIAHNGPKVTVRAKKRGLFE